MNEYESLEQSKQPEVWCPLVERVHRKNFNAPSSETSSKEQGKSPSPQRALWRARWRALWRALWRVGSLFIRPQNPLLTSCKVKGLLSIFDPLLVFSISFVEEMHLPPAPVFTNTEKVTWLTKSTYSVLCVYKSGENRNSFA